MQFLYHRMYVYTEEKYPKSVSSFPISVRQTSGKIVYNIELIGKFGL
jgi:hypothetical protein